MKTLHRLTFILTLAFILTAAQVFPSTSTNIFTADEIRQNQQNKVESERDTIKIKAKVYGDIKIETDGSSSSTVFLKMKDGALIPLGSEKATYTDDDIDAVFVHRPKKNTDLLIEISKKPEELPETGMNESTDVKISISPKSEPQITDHKSDRLLMDTPSDKVIYVLDGEIVDYGLISMLSPGRIKTVTVLKGNAAKDKYKDKMIDKEGVIEIVTHDLQLQKHFTD
ncbi:MAG: hypothetical protein K0B37_09245 [Bacteroidales bacterium]|nr:hypothetical protein [Bacteroidales bacterium]